MSGRAIISGLLLRVSNGRIVTKTARQILAGRRIAWQEKVAKMQAELDAERARGWGFKYIDGKRADWR
jgi:hypothetical protein